MEDSSHDYDEGATVRYKTSTCLCSTLGSMTDILPAIDKIFRATLDALAAIDTFSDSTTPTSFVVYAHDPDNGDDESGPAYSDIVKKFINWMNQLRTRTYSDQHPSGIFAHEIRSSGDAACRDILGNQFCLLPRTGNPLSADSMRPDRVERVIVFGSPRLRSYCQHPFAKEYIDKIKATYEQCKSSGDAELRQRLQHEVLETSMTRPSFHHALTEIAFLELRHQHNHDAHSVVWASVGDDDMKYIRIKAPTNLHVLIDASSPSHVLHSRFFKLLRTIYTANSAAISMYKEAYDKAVSELRKRLGPFSDRELDNLSEKFTSQAQRNLANHRNSELRQLHQRKLHAELGSKGYDDVESRRTKILGSLATIAYRDRKDRNPERIMGTCRWFTQHQKFQEWQKSENGGILWVTAYPGCGKSVLLKHLVDTVLVAPSSAVCYFFFKDDFEDQKSVVGALRCLLHQIFLQRPDLFTEPIIRKFEQDEQMPASASNMWDLLRDVARSVTAGSIIIVIDALDECLQDDRRVLMERLVQLHEDTSMTRLKILISSRLYVDISQGFHKVGFEIHLSAENDLELDQISAEIDLVVSHRLQHAPALVELRPEQRDVVYQALTKVKHKTYLWAYLVLDEIDNMFETDSTSLRKMVQNLPHSVDAAYEKILSKSGQREKVKTMLSIIVAAAEPLNLLQLAQAWALTVDIPLGTELEVASESQIRRTLNGLCGLFVIVVEGRVYLLHQTAREFLLGREMTASSTDSLGSKLWAGSILKTRAELIMAWICLRYFERHEAPPWTIESLRPMRCYVTQEDVACHCLEPEAHCRIDCLSWYAIEHWIGHVSGVQELGDERLTEQAATACEGLVRTFVYPRYLRKREDEVLHMPCLTMASMLGLLSVVKSLLRLPHTDVERPDLAGRTALGWAVDYNHAEVARVLLGQRADVNTKDIYGDPVLFRAVEEGNDAILAMLLESGADPNALNEDGYAVLAYAAKFETAESVLQLLKHGADIDAVDQRGETALSEACEEANLAAVEVLLTAGADPTKTDREGWTPLMHCCGPYSGYVDEDKQIEVAKLLLRQEDIDIHAADEDRNTALSKACESGWMRLAQLLLRHGATISAICFLRAATERNAAILQLLLNTGADINTTDSHGDTALTIAASFGYWACVETLLHNNANPDHAGEYGRTALFTAASKGHREMAELLIRHGASVDRPADDGQTPLMKAVEEGHKDMVLTLLSNNADTECVDSDGLTALYIAAYRRNADVVHSLLDHGAHVNHTNNRAYPALFAAAMCGAVDVFRLLLRIGPDPARTYDGEWSELELAASGGHLQIVELLLPSTDDVALVRSALKQVIKKKRKALKNALLQRIYELQWQVAPISPFKQPGIFQFARGPHPAVLSSIGVRNRAYYQL